MAKLRNKRILAAVSRETPEGIRSSREQTVLDPELTWAVIGTKIDLKSSNELSFQGFLRRRIH